MKIGLPRAFLYHRFAVLWETYFRLLGCDVVVSRPTDRSIFEGGSRDAVDECCLPAKVFFGHVHSLIGRCDAILVPRFDNFGRDEELCARFLGLYDATRHTYPEAALLAYNVWQTGRVSERAALVALGCRLGRTRLEAKIAYRRAALAQREHDRRLAAEQEALWQPGDAADAPRILLAGHPYLLHDGFIGGEVSRLIEEQGGVPLYADRCDRAACRAASRAVCPRLFWTLSKETVGAVSLFGRRADGVILLTAFPCGTSSLVNEMLLLKGDGVPTIQLLMDGLEGRAGLETRVESFMDILQERRRVHAR